MLLRIVAQHVQSIDLYANSENGAHKNLAEAASLLLEDYQEDQELTSFTALDGEPFHA